MGHELRTGFRHEKKSKISSHILNYYSVAQFQDRPNPTMADPTTVYIVLRKDYNRHTDRKRHLALPVGAFETAAAANAAAEAHSTAQSPKGPRTGEG